MSHVVKKEFSKIIEYWTDIAFDESSDRYFVFLFSSMNEEAIKPDILLIKRL